LQDFHQDFHLRSKVSFFFFKKATQFDTREEAQDWFDAYAASDGSSSDSNDSVSSREGSSGRAISRSPKAATGPIPSCEPPSQDGGLPFQFATSDKSKGKAGEVMGVKLLNQGRLVREPTPSCLPIDGRLDLTESNCPSCCPILFKLVSMVK
jgi:hypothetical protein